MAVEEQVELRLQDHQEQELLQAQMEQIILVAVAAVLAMGVVEVEAHLKV